MKSKIVSDKTLFHLIEREKDKGRRIVFTNGCFDILHAGHVSYLWEAKKLGDILVVGLNSDSSISSIKGPGRPVMSETDRSAVLAALEPVDYVVIFDAPDPLDIITLIKPDVLVKGEDWDEKDIIGAGFVKAYGGEVKRIPLVPGRSTTAIIETIVSRFAQKG